MKTATLKGKSLPTKVFGETSTTDEVLSGVNLKGQRVLVTGVSSGLGVEAAQRKRFPEIPARKLGK